MTLLRMRFFAAALATNVLFCAYGHKPSQAGDSPNQITHSDIAAGQFVDSIFAPELPAKAKPRTKSQAPRRRVASRGSRLRAKLVNNPNTDDGSPPYALVDRYGGLLRYIEPVESVDLDTYVGETVAVRHDTGDILLASQLAFPRRKQGGDGTQLTAFQEPTPADEPEPIEAGEEVEESIVGERSFAHEEEGPVFYDEGYDSGYGEFYDEGIDFGGCASCGSGVCRRRGGCAPGARGVIYLRGEYLLWWFDGMDTPPLVTGTDDPAETERAVLSNRGFNDNPLTRILYGGDEILTDARSGGRVTLGVWLDDYGQRAIEGDFFSFGTESEYFRAEGENGAPIISRPYFELVPVGGGPPE